MSENNSIDIDNLELASISARIKAFIIDDISITLLVAIILWDTISQVNGDLIAIMGIMNSAFFQIVFIKFLYQTFFVWYYGATIGKLIVKIRVIDFDDFGKVTLMNSAVRSAGRIISEMVFYLGFLIAFYTKSRQTFHDKFGKTLVVNA
jgi:uncharacterized RDD family membrane protein YckC